MSADKPTTRRLSLTVRRVVKVLEGDEAEGVETAERRGEEQRKDLRFLLSISDEGKALPPPPPAGNTNPNPKSD